MNALLNINIRITNAQAIAQLRSVQSQMKALQTQAAQGGGALGRFSGGLDVRRIENFGKSVQWTGRQLEYNFTLPLVLAGAAATKWALDNEKASVRISKVYGEVGADADMLKAELGALATSFDLLSARYGIHKTEVLEVAGAWAQAGAAGVGLAKATQLTLEAMSLGDMTSTEAVEGMIAVQSAYRLNSDQLRDALANLNAVENGLAIDIPELIQVITRAGGVSREAGIDIRYLAAMASSLVPAAGSAAQAGNGLRTLISRIMAPTKDAAEMMALMGINIETSTWQAMNGVQRIETFAGAFDKLSQAQKNQAAATIFSRWQVNRADILFEDIAKSLNKTTRMESAYARALEITSDQQKANAIYARELSIALSSNPRAFAILTTTIQNALAKAILPLIPALISALSAAARLAVAFANLDPNVQHLIIGALLLLAAVGPLMRYFGALVQLFGVATGAVKVLAIAFGGLGSIAVTSLSFLATMLIGLPFTAVTAAMGVMWRAWVAGLGWAIVGLQNFIAGPLVTFTTYLSTAFPAAVARGWAAVVTFAQAGMAALQRAWLVATTLMGVVWQFWLASFNEALKFGLGIASSLFVAFWELTVEISKIALIGVHKLWIMITSGMQVVFAAFTGTVTTLWLTLVEVAKAVGIGMTMAWRAAIVAMQALWFGFAAFIATMPNIFSMAWSGVLTVTTMAAKGLLAILNGLGQATVVISQVIAWALANPWAFAVAAAAAAAIALVVVFRKQIGNGIDYVRERIGLLPDAFKGAMAGVISVVSRVAKQVYEWLSYLNPFARHSPSLVDMVKAGVSTILDEYSSLRGVTGVVKNMITAHERFNKATAGGLRTAAMQGFQEQRAEILQVAPNAGPAFDSVVASIFEMQDALQLVGDEMMRQNQLVAEWQAALEEAMGPINEKISENEMAQKKLRLEILKMEQAGQSVDDLRDRMAALSGEIELLRGKREDLRLAGAGSDVLASYDAQIASMEAARRDMQQAADAPGGISDLQKQLEDLQRQGEMMQLERDITFDPQIKALEEQKRKANELESAYRGINQAISDMEGLLSTTSSAASRDDAFSAAALGDFPVPGGTAPPGLGREGGLADIEAFNKEMEKKLQEALGGMGKFDMFAPIKDMFKGAWTWIKDNVGPIVGPVWDEVKKFIGTLNLPGLEGIKSAFDGITDSGGKLAGAWQWLKEIGSGFWEILKSIGSFLADVFGPVIEWIGSQLSKFGDMIAKEMKNWAPLWDDLMKALGNVGDMISFVFLKIIVPVIKVALGIILAAWKLVWPVLKHVLTPIIDAIIGIIRGAMEIIRGIITVILALINGDWGRLWDGIVTILDGIWDIIFSIFKGAIGIVIGLVRGLIEGVIAFFKFLWDKLVGHSIIPDIVNGIIEWFKTLWNVLKFIWDAIWAAISWTWDHIAKPVFDLLIDIIKFIVPRAFEGLKTVVTTVFGAIVHAVQWAWEKVLSPVFQGIAWFLGNVVGPAFTWILDHVIAPVFRTIASVISNSFDNVKTGFMAFVNFMIKGINTIIKGLNLIPGNNIPLIPEMQAGGSTNYDLDSTLNRERKEAGGILAMSDVARGLMTSGTMFIIGEGNPAYPEFVIPTDPKYRNEALALMAQLNAQMFERGGVLSATGTGPKSSWIPSHGQASKTENHFHGDLIFPNVKTGEDAESFIRHLEVMR